MMKLVLVVLALAAVSLACPASGGARCRRINAVCFNNRMCCSITCRGRRCRWHPTVVRLRKQLATMKAQVTSWIRTWKTWGTQLNSCRAKTNAVKAHDIRIRKLFPGLIVRLGKARGKKCPKCPAPKKKIVTLWRPKRCPRCPRRVRKIVFFPHTCPKVRCPSCGGAGGQTANDDLKLFSEEDSGVAASDIDNVDNVQVQEKRWRRRRRRRRRRRAATPAWQLAINTARANVNKYAPTHKAWLNNYRVRHKQVVACWAGYKNWVARRNAATKRLNSLRRALRAALNKKCPKLSCRRWIIVRRYKARKCHTCNRSPKIVRVRRKCPTAAEVCTKCPPAPQTPKPAPPPAPKGGGQQQQSQQQLDLGFGKGKGAATAAVADDDFGFDDLDDWKK